MLRRTFLAVAIAAAALGATWIASAGPADRAALPAPSGARRDATPLAPPSCKPSPPVVVSIPAGSFDPKGARLVLVRALEEVPDASVFAGAGSEPGPRRHLVWRGGLAAGEVRRIAVRIPELAGASRIWIEAEVPAGGGVLRSLALAGGGVSTTEAQQRGRLVTDPRTGEATYEFSGEVLR